METCPKTKVLFNPELMDIMLNYLNFDEIKTARLVCKSWSQFGFRNLQLKSGVISFQQNDEDKLQDYVKYFEGTLPPHSSFKLTRQIQNTELITRFFLGFGQGISSLDLSRSKLDLDQIMRKTLTGLEHFSFSCSHFVFPAYSGLILQGKYPTLEIHDGEILKDYEGLRMDFGRFLQQNASVLRNLIFKTTIDAWGAEALGMIWNSGIRYLDSLELCGSELDDECLTLLKDSGLKVKKLKFGLDYEYTPSLLVAMLESQTRLESLGVENISLVPPSIRQKLRGLEIQNFDSKFNRFANLRILEIHNFEGNFRLFGQKKFPCLESLVIHNVKSHKPVSTLGPFPHSVKNGGVNKFSIGTDTTLLLLCQHCNYLYIQGIYKFGRVEYFFKQKMG